MDAIFAQTRREMFPVHNAVEIDDLEALTELLRPKEAKEGSEAAAMAARMGLGSDPPPASAPGGDAAMGEAEEDEEDESDDGSDWEEGDEDAKDEEDADDDVCDLDGLDDFSCTPLHVAILRGSMDCLAYLMAQGADTGIGCEGSPLVHMAVSVGALARHSRFATEAARAIMEHCGRLDTALMQDDFRRTPLHIAADVGSVEAVDLLLAPFAKDDEGTAPDQVKQYLLSKDRLGNTALHYACRGGHVGVVDAIFHAAKSDRFGLGPSDGVGAALCKATNARKAVPLHYAVRQGHARVAWKLAREDAEGGSLRMKDILGNTPPADARAYGHEDLLPLLSPTASEEAVATGEDARWSKVRKNKTLIIRSDGCEKHFTCTPGTLARGNFSRAPPENVLRLKVLTDHSHGGILTGAEFAEGGSTSESGRSAFVWEEQPPKASMSDILRVHDWHYVRHVQETCNRLSEVASEVGGIGSLDGDTQVSKYTFEGAKYAAGASVLAVDKVMEGEEDGEGIRKVFCAVRPPGHHAGPSGAVSGSGTDPTAVSKSGSQSHGFCLLNNVAIAAAYAMNVYRKQIKRVAIVDFDVHHGNGTEACVSSVIPVELKQRVAIGGGDGSGTFKLEGFVKSHVFKPWVDVGDKDAILFASSQGYGESLPGSGHIFYPGTGATIDTRQPRHLDANGDSGSGEYLVDDEHEFQYKGGSRPTFHGPRIINVGICGPGSQRGLWHRAWRDKILPAVARHDPDIIFISAGFDAHAKDDMNSGYIGLLEADYSWVTEELVKIANKHCKGRIVSVLEGGYRIQGGTVSPFARSVAAHVRALGEANFKEWDMGDAQRERQREIAIEEEKMRKQQEELRQLIAEQDDHIDDLKDVMQRTSTAAAAAAAPAPASINGSNDAAAVTVDGSSEGPSNSKRRRRAAVDYVALNAKLEKEQSNNK